jgi:hypothetical protein
MLVDIASHPIIKSRSSIEEFFIGMLRVAYSHQHIILDVVKLKGFFF